MSRPRRPKVSPAKSPDAAAPRAGQERPAPIVESAAPDAAETVAPTAHAAASGFPVVGIGASAGGLHALEEFFRSMPVDSGLAFVVVTHLHPEHTSILPELLARTTRMPVVEAAAEVQVEANHVYVNPPSTLLALRDGALHWMEGAKQENPRLSIDYFFRSLAADRGELAVCIVLSGTGTDGTLGLKAVKAEAGMAMVQQPQSAEFAGMPESAIATGLADYVLPPRDMPSPLVEYVHSLARQAPPTEDREQLELAPLQELLNLLRMGSGHDFSEYKRGTIRRRVERRMNVRHIRDLAGYVHYLQENPAEVSLLFKDLLISVTSFFRDPEAFDALGAALLRQLAAHPPQVTYRAWIAGCASGEEAYSIAILLQEAMQQLNWPLDLQLYATDADTAAIEQARSAVYPDGIAVDMSPERLTRCFVREEGTFRVRKDLREMLIFSLHNIIRDPPFSRLDLVCCRNVLIYLNSDLQKRLIPLFHYALKPGGLLFLGTSESIGPFTDLFEPVDKHWKLYRRKGAEIVHPRMWHSPERGAVEPRVSGRVSEKGPEPMETLFERMLTGQFAPPCVIISDRGDILHFHGRTGAYLEPPTGQPRLNVFEMAREGLRTELTAAVRRASSAMSRIVCGEIRVKANGHDVVVNLEVVPIQEPEPLRGLFLVAFHPIPAPPSATKIKARARLKPSAREAELERELQHARESLQNTVEELETSNEELRSTNEELQSINEELQSANEELETSQEELQSLNEELTTINAELEAKVEELRQANDDMQNLLDSTEIGTLFLDERLCIKRFTEQARKLVNVISTDIGRSIADLTTNLDQGELLADCREVQQSGIGKEAEVCTADGTWYLMKVLPYRRGGGMISGLVVTFVNIARIKQAEQSLRESAERLKAIVETAADSIITIDRRGIIDSLNPAAERLFGYNASEAVGRNVNLLMPSPYAEEHDGYLHRYHETGEARIIGSGRELTGRHKDGRLFPIDLAVSTIDRLGLYTGIIRDITSRKSLEEELLNIASAEQQRIGQDLHDETGQELTALMLLADTLVEEAHSGTPPNPQIAGKFRDGLRRVLNQVRDFSRGLMPVEVDEEGLQAALAGMAAGISELHDIDCTFDCPEPVVVGDNKVATHVYRIAQEAITNAIKHARPHRIQVSLRQERDSIVLRVMDDGQGIPRSPMNENGLGLRIMRHRAHLIGARLTIGPLPGRGTELVCTLAKGVEHASPV